MTSEYEEEAQNLELQISTKTLSSENILRALWSIYVSRRVFSLFWNPSYLEYSLNKKIKYKFNPTCGAVGKLYGTREPQCKSQKMDSLNQFFPKLPLILRIFLSIYHNLSTIKRMLFFRFIKFLQSCLLQKVSSVCKSKLIFRCPQRQTVYLLLAKCTLSTFYFRIRLLLCLVSQTDSIWSMPSFKSIFKK